MSSNEDRPQPYTPSPPPSYTKVNHDDDNKADDESWKSARTPPRIETPFMTYTCKKSHEAGTEPKPTLYFVDKEDTQKMIKAVPYRCPTDNSHASCWVDNPSYDHDHTTRNRAAVALFPASKHSKLYDPTQTEQYKALTLASLRPNFPTDSLVRATRARAEVHAGGRWEQWKQTNYCLVSTDFFPLDEANTDANANAAAAAAVADVDAVAAGTSRAMALAELPGDTPPGTRGGSGSGSGSSGGMGTPTILVSDHAEGSDPALPSALAVRLAAQAVLGRRELRRKSIPRSTPGSAPPSRGRSRATSSVSAASDRGSTTATAGPVSPVSPVSPWHSGQVTPRDDEEAEP